MRGTCAFIILLIALMVSPVFAGYTIGTTYYSNGTQFVVSSSSSVGTITNYPIMIVLSNATGASSSTKLYTNGTTLPNWYDITFTDESDAPLKFWVENGTTTSTEATAWVKIPSLSTSGTTVRAYYGNASKTTSDIDGYGTFRMFDDFLGSAYNTSQWSRPTATGSSTVSNGVVVVADTSNANWEVFKSLSTYGNNTAMISRLKTAHYATSVFEEVFGYSGSGTAYPVVSGVPSWQDTTYGRKWVGNGTTAGVGSMSRWGIADTYYVAEIKRNANTNVSFSVNGTDDYIYPISAAGTQYGTSEQNITFAATLTTSGTASLTVDWVAIRPYQFPEPTTSAYGPIAANASVFTEQDIWMEGEYLQTFVVTDATTDMPINNVTVTDSDGDTTTTASNGTAWLSEPFGADTVMFTATNYDAKTVAYVFDSNATHYVELSPASEDTNYTGPDVTTYPKYVTFHIKEGFGNPVQDVNVSILAVSTSTGNWDWVLTLLGIPLDEVAVNGTEMYQTTDSMGTATFYVIPTAKYNVSFTKSGYTISSLVLVPQDDDYIIWAEGTGATFYENDYDELAMVNISVQTVIINDTHAFINMSYNDTLAHTTGGFINVTQKNASPWGAPVTVASFPAVSSSFTNSTIITHTGQVSGSVACNVSHTDFGQVERSSPWNLKGEAVHFLGFGSDIALLVALGIMMLTVMLAGAVHARHTVVAMAFEGWIFYAIDWFAALEARGVSETVILLALTLLTILGFVAHFEVRKRKEKY